MSDVYVSPKSRVANARERAMVAQTADWQIQHDHLTKRRGVIFKVTDKRSEAVRIADGGPSRRVWSISYNANARYFGGENDILLEYYPEVARWAFGQIAAYCIKHDLTPKPIGRKPASKAEQPEEVA